MTWRKDLRVRARRVLGRPVADTLLDAPQRFSNAWKALGRPSSARGLTNRAYWNEMAESGKVNWHISHHSQDQESEFWNSGNGVMARLLQASALGSLDRLPVGALVLDIGCGRGRIARAFAVTRPDIRVLGVDVSTSMIENARASNSAVANLRFQASDESSFPGVGDASCALVYSYVVFQHLPRHQVEKILVDCRRILAPSGELVFQLQSCDSPQELDPPWNDYRGIRKYTEKQVRHLLERSFQDVRISGSGHDMFAACKPRP